MKLSSRLKSHKQMSEAFLTASFLSLSGGLQDAYTYISRGKVFANAQTGNIVLLSQHIFEGNFRAGMHYLVPLIFLHSVWQPPSLSVSVIRMPGAYTGDSLC